MQTEAKILFEKARKSCWLLQCQNYEDHLQGAGQTFPYQHCHLLVMLVQYLTKCNFDEGFVFLLFRPVLWILLKLAWMEEEGFFYILNKFYNLVSWLRILAFTAAILAFTYLYDLGKLFRTFWVFAFSSTKWTNVEHRLAYNLCSMNIS